jgi:hypothetical protein
MGTQNAQAIYGFAAELHNGVLLVWPAVEAATGDIACYSSQCDCWTPKDLIWFEESPRGRPLDPATLLRCEELATALLGVAPWWRWAKFGPSALKARRSYNVLVFYFGAEKSAVTAALAKYFGNSLPLLEECWAVSTRCTPAQVYDRLKPLLPSKAALIVATLDGRAMVTSGNAAAVALERLPAKGRMNLIR